MSNFNVGDKIEINYHSTKKYIGKRGTVIYVGSSLLDNPMPVNEDYNPEQKYRYIVKLDDGIMLHDLQEIQLRKLKNTNYLKVRDHVMISAKFRDLTLRGSTGRIVALSSNNPSDYLVQIDIGPIAGKKILINGRYLKTCEEAITA